MHRCVRRSRRALSLLAPNCRSYRSIPCGMVACRALQALDDQLIALGLPTSLSAKLRDFYRFM